MKTVLTLLVASLFACAFAAGCGSSSASSTGTTSGSSSGGSDASCTYTSGTSKACGQYRNLTSAEADAVKKSCAGTYGTACDTANILGCCTQAVGSITVDTCYYMDPGVTADVLKMQCTQSNGMWSATP
jgi:hypothetical protein